jgi:hypothetical protein
MKGFRPRAPLITMSTDTPFFLTVEIYSRTLQKLDAPSLLRNARRSSAERFTILILCSAGLFVNGTRESVMNRGLSSRYFRHRIRGSSAICFSSRHTVSSRFWVIATIASGLFCINARIASRLIFISSTFIYMSQYKDLSAL